MAEPTTYTRELQLSTAAKLAKFIQTLVREGDKLTKVSLRNNETEVVLTFEENAG